MQDIDTLPVSDGWKHKFRLIEKAGGFNMPRANDLTFGEKMKVNFNTLAFFFGPIYYVIKGIWRPALVYTVALFAVAIALELAGFGKFNRYLGYGFASVFASRANVSYYNKMVLNNINWF